MTSKSAAINWSVLVSSRLWLAALMGFAAGLPLLLTSTVLQAWLVDADINLTAIGFFGLVGLPYTLKFLWAPLLDRYEVTSLGRRRGWLIAAQFGLAASIFILGFQQPRTAIWAVVLAAFLVTFFSATQDSVIDAYRRESLADNEQGLGASFYTYGYRIGMLLAGAGGLILADIVGFRGVYHVMAGVMSLAILVTVFAPEPTGTLRGSNTLYESFTLPFIEFFTRGGRFNSQALLILVFLIAYKLGDNIGTHMATPFYLGIGFSRTEIGAVAKAFGTFALLSGVFLGGMFVLRLGIFWSLLFVGFLQAFSTAAFAVLTMVGNNLSWLAAVIAFENLSAGMGTTALLALMAALTNRSFTATQFALLSALANAPRAFLVAPSGYFATVLGWPTFFISSALVAIPGMVLLIYLKQWIETTALPNSSVQSDNTATK